MRKGKFSFFTSEIIGNCAFPLSFHGKNSHEILIFFAATAKFLSNNLMTGGAGSFDF